MPAVSRSLSSIEPFAFFSVSVSSVFSPLKVTVSSVHEKKKIKSAAIRIIGRAAFLIKSLFLRIKTLVFSLKSLIFLK